MAGMPSFRSFPDPPGLGIFRSPHRQRSERAGLHRRPKIIQKPRKPDDLLDAGDRQAVHAGSVRAVVTRDPLERHHQGGRATHDVEQVVEPAAGIGRRPTVKLGLHLRYPRPRPQRERRPQGADIHRRVFRHYSIRPFAQPLPSFPMRAGFPRLGVLRQLRPTPIRSADDEPSPTSHVGHLAIRQNQGGSRVHCDSLDEAGAQLYPRGIATATPQHITVASHTDTHTPAWEFPAATPTGAHRARPLSARFEPVYLSRDVITLVPRVLLFTTFAEPAPSGDPGTSRRCQGCSHPPRHLPGQAALSFTVPAATGPAVTVSHPHANHQRLAAHAGSDTTRPHRGPWPPTPDRWRT
jgi:hypothetical protein